MGLAEQLVDILVQNPGRYSIKELAQLFSATDRQVRYALNKLKTLGYNYEISKKRIVLTWNKHNENQGFEKDKEYRQFAILMFLAETNSEWTEIKKLINQINLKFDCSQQTFERDLEELVEIGYLERNENLIRLKQRLIAGSLLSDADKSRLFHFLLEHGYKIERPKIIKPLIAKLCLNLIATNDIEEWDRLSSRIFFLSDSSFIDNKLISKLNKLRLAIAEKRVLVCERIKYYPYQLVTDYDGDIWYLCVFNPHNKQFSRLRVNGLEFDVLQEGFDIEFLEGKQPFSEPGPIRFLVYPDFSVQQKITYQLAGLDYVQVKMHMDRSMEVTMSRPHRLDFIHWLRRFGPSIRVLEPESIKKQLLRSAEKIVELYEGRG